MDGGVKCSLSLSEFVRHWTILVSNFVKLNFMKILSAFLELLAVRETDGHTSGKILKFLVANT